MANYRKADEGEKDKEQQWSGSSSTNRNDISCYSNVIKNLLNVVSSKSQDETKKRYKLVVLRPKHSGDPQQSRSNAAAEHNRFCHQIEAAFPSITESLDTSGSFISKKIKTENDSGNSDWIQFNESSSVHTPTFSESDKTVPVILHMTKTENDVANESLISQKIKTEGKVNNSDWTGHNKSTTTPSLCTPIVFNVACNSISSVMKTENDVAVNDSNSCGQLESQMTPTSCSSMDSETISISQPIKLEDDIPVTRWTDHNHSRVTHSANDLQIFGTSWTDQHRISYYSIEPSLSHEVKTNENVTLADSSLPSSRVSVGNSQNNSFSENTRHTPGNMGKLSQDSSSTEAHTVLQYPVFLHPVDTKGNPENRPDIDEGAESPGVIDRTSSLWQHHPVPQISGPKESQSSDNVSELENEEDSVNKFMETSGKFFKCGFCDEAFVKPKELGRHLKVHSTLHCTHCKTKCSSKKRLEKHQKLCQQFTDSLFTEACPICFKSTPSMELGLHCKSHGVMLNEIMFNCDKCSAFFSFSQRNDVCVHLENNKKALYQSLRYHCSVCKEHYGEIAVFKEHMQTHNIPERASAVAMYTCPMCGNLFSNMPLLEQHLKRRCSRKRRNIEYMLRNNVTKCRFCEAYYQRSRRCSYPKEANNGCIKCRKFLKFKRSLLKQMSTQKIHRCVVCSRSFSRIFRLKSHMRNKHIQENEQKGFKCYICGKVFRNLRNTQLHMNSHIPAPSITCVLCRKKFSYGLHLKLHMKIHTSEMFYCKICYKGFYNANSYFRHRAMNPIQCNCERDASNEKHSSSCMMIRVFFKAGNIYILDGWKERPLHVCRICWTKFETKEHLCHHTKTMHRLLKLVKR